MLGPPDAGKTSLLVQALQDQPVMHVDMREVSAVNPEVFVRRMTEELESNGEYFVKKAKSIQATVEWGPNKSSVYKQPKGLTVPVFFCKLL